LPMPEEDDRSELGRLRCCLDVLHGAAF
jgi:hypothetical protein